MTVAIYLRISHDPLHLAAGVGRQRTDCMKLAAARWPDEPVVEYVDNDISASRYSTRQRVAFHEMRDAISSGAVTAVVGWNFDRLFRQPRELEAFLDLADAHHLTRVVTAQGDVDLTSHDGRLHARILVAVAAKESDDKSRRTKRAMLDRQERGLHAGCRVVWGYTLVDRTPVLDATRAALARNAANRLLGGASMRSVLDWLGPLDPSAPRSPVGLKRSLLSPTRVARTTGGQRGAWEPTFDDGTYAELHALLTDPARRTNHSPTRRWWLAGLVFCGVCGRPMMVTPKRYPSGRVTHHFICRTERGTSGCTSIEARGLSSLIESALDAVVRLVPPAPDPLPAAPDTAALSHLAALYAAGDLTRDEWVAARAAVPHEPTLPPVTRQAEGVSSGGVGGAGGPPLVARRHAYAARVIERVVVARRVVGGPTWQPQRVSIVWRQ